MNKYFLAVLIAILTPFISGCVSVNGGVKKTEPTFSVTNKTTPAAPSKGKIIPPIQLMVTAIDADNQDLVKLLTGKLNKQLKREKIPVVSSGFLVNVKIVEFQKVSKSARFLVGNLAGSAKGVVEVSWEGKSFTLDGKSGMYMGLPSVTGFSGSSDDAIERIAQVITREISLATKLP
jgi:hypothetical protein